MNNLIAMNFEISALLKQNALKKQRTLKPKVTLTGRFERMGKQLIYMGAV